MQDRVVPVFVKINDYKEILDIVDVMKHKLKDAKDNLEKVKQLKHQEEAEIADWEKNIAEISKRLSYVDSAFFDAE